MKRTKLSRKGKKIIKITIISIIFLIGIYSIHLFLSTTIKDTIKETKYYTLKIDLPEIKNKPVRKDIELWAKEKVDNLIKKSKKNTSYLKKNKMKYELVISNNTSNFNGIKTIQVSSYIFIGGNHYEKEYKFYHYKDKNNQEINLKNYFKTDSKYLEKISQLSYFKIKELAENTGKNIEDEWIKKGTSINQKKFDNFEFTENGLNLLFSEYQITSWSEGEIKFTIPYNEISELINFEIPEIKHNKSSKLQKPTRDLNQFKDKKLIAITYDDGPSPKTKILLDEIKEKPWKVTFFTLGSRVKQYPEIVKREYEEGHEVASHTYNHLNLKKLSDYEIYKEIGNSNNEIKNITGTFPYYIRPPYGSTNDHIKQIGNMITVLWSVDTEDWKSRNSDDIYNKIMEHAKDGAIILLHDLYQSSIDGSVKAMAALEQQGYQMVTIDELFKIKNITPNITESYFSLHNQ